MGFNEDNIRVGVIESMISDLVIEKNLIKGLYWGNGMSLKEIGKILECSITSIYNRMKMYNIPRRDIGKRSRLYICDSCEIKFKDYPSNKRGNVIVCSSRCWGNWLRENKKKVIIEPELLWELYWGNQYSMRKISSLFDTDNHTIKRRMDLYQIPIRSKSEAGKLLENKHAIGSIPWNKNITHEKDDRIPSGERSGGWIDGRSSENEWLRRCRRLENWRKQVFERDNFACQICHDKCKEGNRIILNAHHIKSWAEYHNDRFNVDNGMTLCKLCHNWVHHLNPLDFQ